MKEMWETPRISVEEFAPNDYVAACWGVGCDATASNDWEKTHDSPYAKSYDWQGNPTEYYTWNEYNTLGSALSDSHSSDHCGNSSNQVIYDDNNDGTADRMVEVGTDGLGTLGCTIWTDINFNVEMSIKDVSIGNTIYWTTQSGNRIWHHIGKVFATVFGHPNRS